MRANAQVQTLISGRLNAGVRLAVLVTCVAVGLWLGFPRRQADEPVAPHELNRVVKHESIEARRDAPLTFVQPSAVYDESVSVVQSVQGRAEVASAAQLQARVD